MALFVDVEKQLGVFRLRVQFQTDGAVLALLGASGSGKSVCLRCIAGLTRPDRGRIVLNGRVLFDSEAGIDLPPQKRRVGYLFQNYALFPNMTALQNVRAALHRLPRQVRTQRAGELLRSFRLEALEKKYPAQLSGGEQQRVALARILASEPKVLLLDEPFSALDDHLKWQLELSLTDMLRSYGGEVILVSHSRDEVCRLSREVCVLTGGRSEPVVSVRALMETPGTVSAALLSGCKNISPALPEGEGLLASAWGWSMPIRLPEGITHVGIRAHSLRLGEGALRLPCRLSQRIDNVFSEILILETPGGVRLRMEVPKDAALPEPGQEVTVSAAPEDVMLLAGGEDP